MSKTRFVREPVGWLLGPELISKLTKILRNRSDPRDWMPYYRGCVHDECWNRDGKLVQVVEAAAQGTRDEPAGAEQVDTRPPVTAPPPARELWFDYVADMGDGEDSMYAVAYATMVGLDGDAAATTWGPGTDRKELTRVTAGRPAALPRGAFLFIGGDTAYHVADGPTLRSRVEEPFGWAFEDAQANSFIASSAKPTDQTYRVYGIPGNHDWYDNLEGFSLVFRLGSPSSTRADHKVDPIQLPQLARVQLASYVAIQLPYGWQLWGLDIDTPMDARQESYFQSLKVPERLIVATPSPAIVFGAAVPGKDHRDTLAKLNIPMPTIPVDKPTTPPYRLDLSGDVHHYARYYPNDQAKTYGSVISGLGGAFHHPTFTRVVGAAEPIEPVRLYPTPDRSRESCGDQLLTWRSTWFGSWARLIPFLLTLICGFAATRSLGGAWLLDHLLSVLPGYEVPAPAGGATQLLRALCAFGVLALAVGGVVLALWFSRRVYNRGLSAPASIQSVLDLWKNRNVLDFVVALFDTRRSYWFAWLIGSVATAPFVLYSLWAPETHNLRLDVAVMIVVFALPLVGAIVGYVIFGEYAGGLGRLLVGLTGLLHAAAQVATAILVSRLATTGWIPFATTIGAIVVAALALWLARPLFRREGAARTLGLAALALVVVGGSLAAIVVSAGGKYVSGGAWYWDAVRFCGSGVVAMPLGTIWFIWYLSVAGRLNAHNNEVGGTARVTAYRELIRFRVHEGGLTGYVIAVENASTQKAAHEAGKHLTFELIDVFTIPAPPPVANLVRPKPASDDRLEH